ncbi:Transducin/WD40 repeat-like superfamily protein isoform 5 [Hibiscus syriacus]|uniref:Transducin/WD40 repeat-like superfamily protein isoform 5 n=1 Tax=Hibiscus syriacus TaxID=106335 RepID=A0A6A3CAW3_HIBSY|nr:Transducin/WD40 repeat-like superfamily protein isoform 5 [Hibiscus syriacus]
MHLHTLTRLVSENGYRTCDENDSNIETVTEKSKEILSPQTPSTQEALNESLNLNEDSNVKFVNGVAVVRGRTRSLVERFERRDLLNSSDDSVTDASGSEGGIPRSPVPRRETTPTSDQKGGTQISKTEPISANDISPVESLISTTESASSSEGGITRSPIPRRETTPTSDRIITGDRISRRESTFTSDRMNARNQISRKETTFASNRIVTVNQISRRESNSASSGSIIGNLISRRESTSASDGIITKNKITQSESTSISDGIVSRNQLSRNDMSRPTGLVTENQISRGGLSAGNDGSVTIIESQIPKGESISANDGKLAESLMQMHDVFLSTLRSRLTKLQVVRHFWEKTDIKGSIGALWKLPDHSVQANVIGVPMEKMEVITLELFSILLPVLIGLLDSKMERHVNVSLEMLLKLVAVFGPMIRSTVSAPRGVGVDLHAEQRFCLSARMMQSVFYAATNDSKTSSTTCKVRWHGSEMCTGIESSP